MNLFNSRTYVEDLSIALSHSIGIEQLGNKRVLITGATGTIGSFIADMLVLYNKNANANIRIYVVGRNIERLKERYSSFDVQPVITLEYDVNSPIQFDVPVDFVIHAAGNAHPAAFNSDPVGTIMGNIIGTYNLLEYMQNHAGKRLLYVSSGEVYGQGNLKLDEFQENYAGYLDISSPRSCYPSSKRVTENLCASYSKQYGLETVVVRPCHTYGPVITSTDNRANAQFIRNALNGENIIMKSAGSQIRSYNYIADCASAILTVLVYGTSGEAYNIANPNVKISIADLAKIIAKTAGKQVLFVDPNAVDLANRSPITKQVLNCKKIEALGWTSAYTVEKGITNTIRILQGK